MIMQTMADYVHSFHRGIIKTVASAHWMENAIPDRVARGLDLLEKKVAKQ